MSPLPPRGSLLDTDRINAFSDGIFAFAATLLVLQIPIPSAAAVGHQDLATYLANNGFVAHLATFVLSFIVVATYRSAHHRSFSRIPATDGVIRLLNTAFLLCIAFLPFPTALFSTFGNRLAFLLYAGTLALSGCLLMATGLYASVRPALMPTGRRQARADILGHAVAPVIFLLSIPLALWNVRVAVDSWALILVLQPLLAWRRRRTVADAVPAPAPTPSLRPALAPSSGTEEVQSS